MVQKELSKLSHDVIVLSHFASLFWLSYASVVTLYLYVFFLAVLCDFFDYFECHT